MRHLVTNLGISMNFNPLLSALKIAKCLGENRNKNWKKKCKTIIIDGMVSNIQPTFWIFSISWNNATVP